MHGAVGIEVTGLQTASLPSARTVGWGPGVASGSKAPTLHIDVLTVLTCNFSYDEHLAQFFSPCTTLHSELANYQGATICRAVLEECHTVGFLLVAGNGDAPS